VRGAHACAALVVALACGLCAGCGGVVAADLFVVSRTGPTPHSHLTLLVNEEGNVRCNGGPTLKLSDSQLVKARAIQEEVQSDSSRHLVLAPRPRSVFRYFLRDENGWVRFSDNSAGQPAVLRDLQLFVITTAQQVCHLPE
jgi:hypothetical protein